VTYSGSQTSNEKLKTAAAGLDKNPRIIWEGVGFTLTSNGEGNGVSELRGLGRGKNKADLIGSLRLEMPETLYGIGRSARNLPKQA